MKYRIRQDIMSDGSVEFWPEQKSGWWSPWLSVNAVDKGVILAGNLADAKRLLARSIELKPKFTPHPPRVLATKFHPYP